MRSVDAICVDDGELVVPALADALERQRQRVDSARAAAARRADGRFERDAAVRAHVSSSTMCRCRCAATSTRGGANTPVCCSGRCGSIETARGCPFRCSFCSVWPLHDRAVRLRSIESVCDDFAATGPNVFVADDLFWYQPARSLELAGALKRRGIRKRWLLVQSRTDLVARASGTARGVAADRAGLRHLLRPRGGDRRRADRLVKDTTVDRRSTPSGSRASCGYGVTGNFVIDPDWDESDFERLWAFVEKHDLGRAGFTILTPLPGTAYFDEMRPRLRAVRWSQYDMHHVLWEPRLGRERFFELYCETWRRSILNLGGEKSWRDWARQVSVRDVPFLTRMLLRTQRMMRPEAYLREHVLAEPRHADARSMRRLAAEVSRPARVVIRNMSSVTGTLTVMSSS